MMTDKEYTEFGGTRCPYCESLDLEHTMAWNDGIKYHQDVECMDCGRSWEDVYELKGYRRS